MKIQEPLRYLEPLCHYVKLEYFEDFLRKGRFYLNRMDQLHGTDPGEGTFNPSDLEIRLAHLRRDLELVGQFPGEVDSVIEMARTMRLDSLLICPHILCFRRELYSNQQAWNEYLKGNEGVMLRTTSKRLYTATSDHSIRADIKFDAVVYQDHDADSKLIPGWSPVYFKDSKFEWEREVRLSLYRLPPAYFLDGTPYDLNAAMKLVLAAKDSTAARIELDWFMRTFLKEVDLASVPTYFDLSIDVTHVFDRIMLSPGMSAGSSNMVRDLVADAGVDPVIVKAFEAERDWT